MGILSYPSLAASGDQWEAAPERQRQAGWTTWDSIRQLGAYRRLVKQEALDIVPDLAEVC
jgi:hypothetical protein